jgi:hypothetical protein
MSEVVELPCRCKACRTLVAQGGRALSGKSAHPDMHILAADLAGTPVRRPRAPMRPIVEATPADFTEEQCAIIADVIGTVCDEWEGRCAALESRIAALEARTAPAEMLERLAELEQQIKGWGNRGVWQAGMRYERNNFVTDHGSLWQCRTTTTTARPGDNNSDWALVAKRGQNGRDGKDWDAIAARRSTTSHRGPT